ncbi:3-dehydroquinate synthase [Clostridium swellfunianum]|uniref:3-dehydroquinate synthase n=1 Tax=Clostridium swellfunianum TaxID=1367462 RepID=UPI00202F2BBD|nr:3-dehydroquinate synthase [Clostridium swellfunianum]MCM0650403.1 3-dehydroquinate synthase [Clostridium swellfunianum]
MEELKIDSLQAEYKVYIDNSFEEFKTYIYECYGRYSKKIFIVTDDRVASFHKNIIDYFRKDLTAKVFTIKNGEESKNYDTISDVYKFLTDNGADRDSLLIAFGGGVVGDLTGFAAATYMRGIGFINIPTTLMSQVDSSIGGKVGYNHNGIKNIIGAFYNPEAVYISTHFLKTLEKQELLDGLGEILKYGLIRNEALLDFIESNYSSILSLEEDSLIYVVKECLSIKAETIAEDYKDIGFRNILNFGHTIGHGIEIDSNYTITHGISVALGMLAALKLSEEKLQLPPQIYSRIENLYIKLGIPIRYKVDNFASFLYAIKHDKKNSDGIRFVLLEDIGLCRIKVVVSEKDILSALQRSICNVK